jgi:N-acetylglucosamine-6-phosphate deacetylase
MEKAIINGTVLSAPPNGANCLGIHIEGLHLSSKHPGMAIRATVDSISAKHKGRLEPGCDADIVILDHDIKPFATFVDGRLVYQRS